MNFLLLTLLLFPNERISANSIVTELMEQIYRISTFAIGYSSVYFTSHKLWTLTELACSEQKGDKLTFTAGGGTTLRYDGWFGMMFS